MNVKPYLEICTILYCILWYVRTTARAVAEQC